MKRSVRQLAEGIRRLRTSTGQTQTALAKKAGITRAYWCLLEQAKRNPTWKTLESVAKALGVPITTLMEKS